MTSPVPFPNPPRKILPGASRRIGFAALSFAAALLRMASAPVRKHSPEAGVVILEPFGMGDALLLQPLVRAHLAAGNKVTLAARAKWAAFFPPHPRFKFIPVAPEYSSADPKTKRMCGGIRAIARALRPHARGADGIDPRGDPRALLALYLAGCGRVYTLPRYWSANDCRMLPFAARIVPLDRTASRRMVSRAFAPVGVEYGRVDLSHLALRAKSETVGIVPLTPWHGKRWPPGHWRELLGLIRKAGVECRVLCGPGESAEARNAIGDAEVDFEEVSDVAGWAAALSSCRAIVSVNTGPMHVADALGIPLVVLDGPSRLPLWAPEGSRAVVLHRQDIAKNAPCHPAGDGLREQRQIMALVSPEETMQALSGILQAR